MRRTKEDQFPDKKTREKNKIKLQLDNIEQQKIGILKAIQSTSMSLQPFVHAITQVVSRMYLETMKKDTSRKQTIQQ